MQRRQFLQAASGMGAVSLLPAAEALALEFSPSPSVGWRMFEVTTRVELSAPSSLTRVWLPVPAFTGRDWIHVLDNRWQGQGAEIKLHTDAIYGARLLAAQWAAGAESPVLELTSRFITRDRAVDFSRHVPVVPLTAVERRLYTQATQLLPTDGIVRDTALEITRGARSDLSKARALYEWVVEKTSRNPKTRGCGVGDIRGMLETGDLSGKCADLNALYVGLARSVGLPARDVYGIRVADSRFGYKSLGRSGDISKAQHCRAEVWLDGFGWVPVDPADVRKVMLEERTGLTLNDDLVVAVRAKLFGAWEMNWLAFNDAHDIALPGSKRSPAPFLMYPQAENAERRFDSLDPDNFRYRITAREIV